MLLSPRIGLWIALVGGPGRALRRPVRAGALAAVAAVPQRRSRSASRTRSSTSTSGFYVFDYPFWRYLLGVGFTATALAVLGALAVHYLFGGVRLQGVGDRMTTAARAHLTALVALFVLLKAVAYFLDRRALLLDYNAGTDTVRRRLHRHQRAAAGEGDPHVHLDRGRHRDPGLLQRRHAQPGLAGASLALLGISAVAIGGIYPAVVQQFKVKPSLRRARRRRTSSAPSTSTRQAYGLEDVADTQYSAQVVIPPASLATDKTVVPTIRLLDPAVVNETFTQLQQVRGFYDFAEKLDIDRYIVERPAAGLRRRRPRDQLRRADRTADQLAQPAHRLSPTATASSPRRPTDSAARAPFFVSGFLGTAGDGGSRDDCSAQSETIKVDPAAHLLRRAGPAERLRDRRQAGRRHRRRVRPPIGGRASRTAHLRRRRRRRGRLVRPPAALRPALPRGELPALRRVQRQLEADVRAQPARAGGAGRAVPDARRRPVPGGGRRPGRLDPRRLHHRRPPTRTRSGSTCTRQHRTR